ncbi:MAG: ribosomal protein S18-alanine N-acetyltransferase [Candidatus Cloacimonetes bacterium]|nr:ribosomal protein S18-alanine N-acetyltransferase [Candidatus Cloacimonadota bacterium]
MISKNENLGLGVRQMTLIDLDDIYSIESNSFPDPWAKVTIEDSIKKLESYALCYLNSGEIVGYLIGYGSEEAYSIYNIAIKSFYQRRGFATYLLQTVMQHHKKLYEHYLLEVRRSNIKAANLYFKLGFKIIYTRRNYYTNPLEDAVVMQFTIKNRMIEQAVEDSSKGDNS